MLTFGLLFLKGSEKTIALGSRVYLLLFSVHLCIYHFIYLEDYLFYKKIGNMYSPYVCHPYVYVCVYLYVLNILLYFCSCFRIWKLSQALLPLMAGARIPEWLKSQMFSPVL